MPNDLVPTRCQPVETSPWDDPPLDPGEGDDFFSEERRSRRGRKADQDAEDARRRGDRVFAHIREEDAAAERQGRYDPGDAWTWTILILIAVIGIAICSAAYFFPHGPDTAQPPIHVY